MSCSESENGPAEDDSPLGFIKSFEVTIIPKTASETKVKVAKVKAQNERDIVNIFKESSERTEFREKKPKKKVGISARLEQLSKTKKPSSDSSPVRKLLSEQKSVVSLPRKEL